MRRGCEWASVGLLLGVVAGCIQAPAEGGAPPGDSEDAGGVEDAGPSSVPSSEVRCDARVLRVSRVHGWPGGGLQLSLSLRDDTGAPLPYDSSEAETALSVLDVQGEPLKHALARVDAARGITALVLAPRADAQTRADVAHAAAALVEALPEDESIVLWSGEPSFPLVADATAERAHLRERLEAWRATEPASWHEGELARLMEAVARLDNPFRAPLRGLVLVGFGSDEAPPVSDEPPFGQEPVVVLRLHAAREGEGALEAAYDASSWGASASIEQAATALASHLGELRGNQVRVGLCARSSARVQVRLGEHTCDVEVPSDVVREHGQCVLAEVAGDAYPLGEVIDFHLTPAERALHDEYGAKDSDREFTAHVSIGGGPKLRARAHFRGQTSLECERKNYSVNLIGKAPRRLFADGGDDELYLISMCKEQHYYRQVLANRVLRDLGVFPLEQRYVEVRVDGESRGPYLLLRKPTEFARATGVATGAVIRRRLDPDNKPAEARHPSEPEAAQAALAEYAGLAEIAATEAPGKIYGALRERLDVDAYLRWMAFHTYMSTGDYVDEIFFHASREVRAGSSVLYFRPLAWDSDDLFKACHHGGRFAHVDPNGLLYCAEGDLDLGLLRDPEFYARFVDQLEGVMARWTPERVRDELAIVREELFSIMDEPRVCVRASELIAKVPAASTCEGAQAAITASMEEFVELVRARSAKLEAAVQAYKGTP